MVSLLYADAPAQAAAAAPAPSPILSFVPLLVIFAIFYFLLIRPQQKKIKEHQKLVNNLKVGDKVVTASGIFGTVVGLGDTTLEVKIAENVKIKILKSAISEVLGAQEKAPAAPANLEIIQK